MSKKTYLYKYNLLLTIYLIYVHFNGLCIFNLGFCFCIVCDRLSVVITTWGAQQKRTTAASATGTAPPADWCADTTNPSMLQEKVCSLF